MSIAEVLEAQDRRQGGSFLRFPGNRLVDNARLEGAAAKAIWLVIPLEYYVLTRFQGGLAVDSFVPAAAMALISVLAMITASAVVALMFPWGGRYVARFRGWAVALLTIWGISLALLALSYFATFHYMQEYHDVFGKLICDKWGCARYPGISWQTLLAYGLYAVVAGILSAGVLNLTKDTSRQGDTPVQGHIFEPNILVAALIAAFLMMILHRASTVS